MPVIMDFNNFPRPFFFILKRCQRPD
nr:MULTISPECIES: hypothetical protein [unclassified Microcystis]